MTETNSKRALGIVGSPRRGGNTEILVDEVLRGAEEAGAQVEKVIPPRSRHSWTGGTVFRTG